MHIPAISSLASRANVTAIPIPGGSDSIGQPVDAVDGVAWGEAKKTDRHTDRQQTDSRP